MPLKKEKTLPAPTPILSCDVKFWGPPGTGKTYRGAQFLAAWTDRAAAVCAVTYRRDLAKQLSGELQGHGIDAQEDAAPWPWVGTVHGVARRALGYDMLDCADSVSPRGEVSDEEEEERARTDFFRLFFEENGIPYKGSGRLMHGRKRGDLLLHADAWMRHTLEAEHIQEFPRWREFGKAGATVNGFLEFREAWSDFKAKNGLWDWTDLLTDALDAEAVPGGRFLFLDEAQDNSPLMHSLVAMWAGDMDAVAVSGDPNQAIYSFIGADPALFWDLTEAEETEELEECRRFPERTWRGAEEVLRYSGHPMPDLEFVEGAEGAGAVGHSSFTELAGKLENAPADADTFHLVRTRRQIKEVGAVLDSAGVPWRGQGGLGWRERERRLLNALIKAPALAAWTGDVEPPEALGTSEAKELIKIIPAEYVRGTKKTLLEEPLENGVPADMWGEFFAPSVEEFLTAPMGKAVRLKKGTRDRLGPALPRMDSSVKTVNHEVCTIHSAKGREKPRVYLYDGVTRRIDKEAWPYHDRPTEARVWFVGLTRHKEFLVTVSADDRMPSRFLEVAQEVSG